MKQLDNVIKKIPEKLIKHCELSGDYIVIIIASDLYEGNHRSFTKSKDKKGMYRKGYKVEVSDQASPGSIYITTRK